MSVNKYGISQQDLYGVARLGWSNCLKQIGAFSEFSRVYTPEFAQERLREIQDVKEIPSGRIVRSESEIGRVQLTQLADNAISSWQRLKRYTEKAFPGADAYAIMTISGQPWITKATRYNWESIHTLLTEAMAFIIKNEDALLRNHNMPADFRDVFTGHKKAYEEALTVFRNVAVTAPVSTGNKAAANAMIYDKLRSMFKDGQKIFAGDPVLKDQFVFASVKTYIRGTKPAGFRGRVTNATTGKAIAGASIAIVNEDYSTLTNDKGQYYLGGLAAGAYNLAIAAPGYIPVDVPEVVVKTGSVSSRSVALAPVAKQG